MAHDHIRFETGERVATITIDRPEKLNALSFAMADALVALVERAGADDDVSVLVIRGEGSSFCSGVDIDDHVDEQAPAGKSLEADEADIAAAAARWLVLWHCPKPVIVAVQGWSAGWGLEIALHADVVLASTDARFFFPSVRNGGGLPDSAIAVYHLGPQWAKRLLLTGEVIDATVAERIGLVSQTCPAEQLEPAVAAMARRSAALPASLLAHSKAVINQSIDLMGRRSLQNFAEHANAIARRDPEVAAFGEILRRDGAAGAIAWREQRLR